MNILTFLLFYYLVSWKKCVEIYRQACMAVVIFFSEELAPCLIEYGPFNENIFMKVSLPIVTDVTNSVTLNEMK